MKKMTAAAVALSALVLSGCGGGADTDAPHDAEVPTTTTAAFPSPAEDAITYEVSAAGVTTAITGVEVDTGSPVFAAACDEAEAWFADAGERDDQAYLEAVQKEPDWPEHTPERHALVIAAAETAASGSC